MAYLLRWELGEVGTYFSMVLLVKAIFPVSNPVGSRRIGTRRTSRPETVNFEGFLSTFFPVERVVPVFGS